MGAAGDIILGIIAIFLPPVPVLIRTGCDVQLLINIVLLLLMWVPAVIHAWWVLYEFPKGRQRRHPDQGRRWINASQEMYNDPARPAYNDKAPPPAAVGQSTAPYPPYNDGQSQPQTQTHYAPEKY